jgi:rhodanese-related sulfurtransferase
MRRGNSTWIVLLIIASAVVGGGGILAHAWNQRHFTIGFVKQHLAERFPEQSTMGPRELAEWLASATAPILLDARSRAEWQVSRLPGAVFAGFDPTSGGLPAIVSTLPATAPILVYDHVGLRSAALVARLHKQADREAVNLLGGIIFWANEGLPLVDERGPTSVVHPGERAWKHLLDPRFQQP